MPELPVISVIIPCFNAERYLAPTLATVLKQNYPKLEVIIQDGGSKDRTRLISDLYGPLVTQFRSEPDKGQLDAVEKGIRAASGDICYWLNADDAAMPGAFHYVADVFTRHPETELLFCNSYAFSAEQRTVYLSADVRFHSFWDHFLHYQQIYSEGVYWKRAISEQALPVDTSLRLCTDYALFMELGWKRNRCWVPRRLGAFREVPGGAQLSGQYSDRLESELSRMKNRLREKMGMSPEEFERLRKKTSLGFRLRNRVWPKSVSACRFVARKLTGDIRRRRLAAFLFDQWLVPPKGVWDKLPEDLRHI
jgi:glycosyltransferase involved in cell wall biosynthesis